MEAEGSAVDILILCSGTVYNYIGSQVNLKANRMPLKFKKYLR